MALSCWRRGPPSDPEAGQTTRQDAFFHFYWKDPGTKITERFPTGKSRALLAMKSQRHRVTDAIRTRVAGPRPEGEAFKTVCNTFYVSSVPKCSSCPVLWAFCFCRGGTHRRIGLRGETRRPPRPGTGSRLTTRVNGKRQNRENKAPRVMVIGDFGFLPASGRRRPARRRARTRPRTASGQTCSRCPSAGRCGTASRS
jgi:hypothetical protein